VQPPRAEVTTIIPTRDREDLLPRTLLCALGQENVETEVIVVDDGSRRPVKDLFGPDGVQSVRVIRHETPAGPPSARNTGIAEARGGWVAFLDDDDLWAPDKLRRQLDVATEAGADFAFCGGVMADRNGVPIRVEHPPPPDEHLHVALLGANVVPFPHSNLLIRTDLLRSLGGFDPELFHLSDWDLLVRLSAEHRAAVISEPLVGYTIHTANMHQDDGMLAGELRRFERKHAEERAELGVALNRASWLRWRVSARRAGGQRLRTAATYFKLAWLCRDPGLGVRGITLAVGGERAMRAGRALRHRTQPEPGPAAPSWLVRAANPSPAALQAALR
jgi:glycosyltransferase involved in cell wall biosynthesis